VRTYLAHVTYSDDSPITTQRSLQTTVSEIEHHLLGDISVRLMMSAATAVLPDTDELGERAQRCAHGLQCGMCSSDFLDGGHKSAKVHATALVELGEGFEEDSGSLQPPRRTPKS
jgi:hypothetical protein